MDREEYEAVMAHRRRQFEDAQIASGEALFGAIQRAMQLHGENRDSRRDGDWRRAMISLVDEFDRVTRQTMSDAGVVYEPDLN